MRSWRRSNGWGDQVQGIAGFISWLRELLSTLESEIASEQARSAALRDAFEGRRSRFATAETGAHKAETGHPRLAPAETAAHNAETGHPTGGPNGVGRWVGLVVTWGYQAMASSFTTYVG
eukprot:Skav229812  [mRNA]  locus=scaffold567:364873:366064:- [translate_table: standard]